MLNFLTKNWKTTLAGLVAVASTVIASFFPEHQATFNTIAGILAGLGLIAAKDYNVSGTGK
jgi:hypothetical protein